MLFRSHARGIRYRDPDLDEAVEVLAPLPSFWPGEVATLLGE